MTNVITHYRTDQAKNQAYPVEKDFPLTGHNEITANIKRHTNVKGIVHDYCLLVITQSVLISYCV